MTTAVIYSNGSQECERIAQLLRSISTEFHRYELGRHFEQHQFEMEFGGDASYPQVSLGNKHIGNMHDTLNYMKNMHMLDK
jgi:glutaredoxin